MKIYKLKTPKMKEGPERELMMLFLSQVKQVKGLTTLLDTIAGINGKWLTPDEPLDINVTKLLKVLLHKAHYQLPGEFETDCKDFINFLYKLVKKHAKELGRR